jgi:hypothetical protein
MYHLHDQVTTVDELGTSLAITSYVLGEALKWEARVRKVKGSRASGREMAWVSVWGMMTEAIRSSETYILIRARHHNVPESDILHSHRRENLKSKKYFSIVTFSSNSFCLCENSANNSIQVYHKRPTPWSNEQSSWLQSQGSRVPFPALHIFWAVVCVERGPLSLARINVEPLEKK